MINNYGAAGNAARLQRERKLKNDIRELLVSSDHFTVWLLGFGPDDIVGQAGIPDRDPLVQFMKALTGYDCILRNEGQAMWARDEVWTVSTEAEGVALPYWVYKYSQQFESWPQGQPVKMSDCLAALKASES